MRYDAAAYKAELERRRREDLLVARVRWVTRIVLGAALSLWGLIAFKVLEAHYGR